MLDPLEPARRRLEWTSRERREAIERELAAMNELAAAVDDDPELAKHRETIRRALRELAEAEAGMSAALEALKAQLRAAGERDEPPI